MSESVDALLRQLLQIPDDFGWSSLELFHARWETLRFTLLRQFAKKTWLTLSELYPAAIVFKKSESDEQPLFLSTLVPIQSRTLEREPQTLTELSQSWCAARKSNVVLMAPGNKGFDIAIPFGEDCVVLVDAKHSGRTQDTHIDPARDVVSPWKKCNELLDQSIVCFHSPLHFDFFVIQLTLLL